MKKVFMVMIFPVLACVAQSPSGSHSVPSLYKIYLPYFPIGTAINPDVDLASSSRQSFIAAQFNSLTAENQMKPKQIHPREDGWNWEPADKIVRFAREHKMKLRGHTLVWHQNVPDWMIKKNGEPGGKAYLYEKMNEHISAVMKRYKDDVYCWDVVNGAISDVPGEIFRSRDSLYAIAGADYVAAAFRMARAADPRAQLYYNDYRFSDPVKRKKIFDLVKSLVDQKVPIDGIGLQSHYVPDEVTREYLQETIDMFSSLGLKIQITELDVSVYNYRDKKSRDADPGDEAYTDQRRQKQEDMYKMLFEVYRKNKDKITGVTFWGASDLRKNYRTIRIGKMDYPFLFDEQLQPKKALRAVTQF